ncbi:MAG: hypothetical protein E6K81_13505 [Candidatus Eisenbacteria bacterium]|uniref:DUF1761 domain-containing protein n=1 Tax=Eiseniibacteriota bacterium TaxID=2212470 RepID=A0A538U2B9_UNCEI|nr:MAG: hypothetical protein E6K81_13505 [Candidatus Eisenbacteria bacterium]
MVSLMSLWLPILLSAVLVFVASSVIHMMIPMHKSDHSKLPSEAEAMEALRKYNIPPGDYMVPRCDNMKDMKSPEFAEKMKKGPVIVMTVMPSGPMSMGPSLVQWFIYSLVVGVLAAYVTGRALGPGEPYLKVFRFAGATAFIAYAIALWQDSIWYKRKWSTTIKYTFDGLIYGLLTAGCFGWLWPR